MSPELPSSIDAWHGPMGLILNFQTSDGSASLDSNATKSRDHSGDFLFLFSCRFMYFDVFCMLMMVFDICSIPQHGRLQLLNVLEAQGLLHQQTAKCNQQFQDTSCGVMDCLRMRCWLRPRPVASER